MAGTQLSQKTQATVEAGAIAAAQAAAMVQAQIAQSYLQPTLAPPVKRIVKNSTVLEQGSDTEVPLMLEVDMKEGYKRCYNSFKNFPSPDDDVTIEQLSGLNYYIQIGSPPWADFAIFGPHGQRLMCKLKTSGLRLHHDGTFPPVEYKGPITYRFCEQCYSILRTLLIFLDAAELGPLEQYKERIQRYGMEYPPSVWHLIYQADHRMRKEHMERIFRKGELLKSKDASHLFDPQFPWRWV